MNFDQQEFEFLDIITILSFAMQLHTDEQIAKQATNNDILVNLHRDLAVVDTKLNAIIKYLGINLDFENA